MNQDLLILLKKMAIGILIGMMVIGAIKVINGKNHRLGEINVSKYVHHEN